MKAAFLVLLALSTASASGSWEPCDSCDELASVAVHALKARSDDLTLSELEYDKVIRAETQVVAGKNYRITAALKPHGSMELNIFEQSWNNVLQITKATLVPSDVSFTALSLVAD